MEIYSPSRFGCDWRRWRPPDRLSGWQKAT